MEARRAATTAAIASSIRRAAVLATLLAGVAQLAVTCNGSPNLIQATLNAIPDGENDLLVVPPWGFTIDVTFPDPQGVQPGTLTLAVHAVDGGSWSHTNDLVASSPNGAVFAIPESEAHAPGSYWAEAKVRTTAGHVVSSVQIFAVRPHPGGGPPLQGGQWVQLDFAADPDGDGQPDLEDDLAAFGLSDESAPSLALQMFSWVTAEILSRTEAFYTLPNPSGLPGGDAADVTIASGPNPAGPTTRICVGGADPTGGPSIGSVLFDPGNANRSQVACDDFLPTGIFPRELLAYGGQSSFQGAFGPVQGVPVGTHPLDPVVLGAGYDPGDPDQLARRTEIEAAVAAFGQAVATVTAHELGHALGLVPPGAPGGGLFGGSSGPALHHNQLPEGGSPPGNLLMNAGSSFSFSELSGAGGALPTFRELNWAYLRGRLALDPMVTGIFPAPTLSYASPTEVSLSGPPLVPYDCYGENLLPTPTIRLLGPVAVVLANPYWVSENEVQASISVLQLLEGTYDVELTNPDGQQVVLDDALVVTP